MFSWGRGDDGVTAAQVSQVGAAIRRLVERQDGKALECPAYNDLITAIRAEIRYDLSFAETAAAVTRLHGQGKVMLEEHADNSCALHLMKAGAQRV